MILTDANGKLIRSGANGITVPDFHSAVAWDHSWDAAHAELYVPSAQEQSDYSISATPRVHRIRDVGANNMDLVRDETIYGTVFGGPSQLPGPLLIPSSARFRGRPAVFFDQVFAGPDLYSILSPNRDFTDNSTWFDAPNGYAAPYWTAHLVRVTGVGTSINSGWDCTLGGEGTGHTIHAGNQAGGGTNWSAACWNNDTPGNTIGSGHAASADETVLIICQVVAGVGAASLGVYWRDNLGQLGSVAPTGTIDTWNMKECFFGWRHTHYLSAAGLKLGTATLGELVAVIEWATPYLAPRSPLPAGI